MHPWLYRTEVENEFFIDQVVIHPGVETVTPIRDISLP